MRSEWTVQNKRHQYIILQKRQLRNIWIIFVKVTYQRLVEEDLAVSSQLILPEKSTVQLEMWY